MSTPNTLPLQKERHAWTIFCDDLRHETNKKMLVVGMYGQDLILPSLPTSIPSLTALVSITTPRDRPFQRLVLRLLLDTEVISELAVPEEQLEKTHVADGITDDALGVRVFGSRAVIRVHPLNLLKPSILRVRVETESEILPGGALRIALANSPSD